MHKRRIYKAHPNCRWRTLRSRARSSRMYHTSDPVPIRRPASLDWTSSRPHLAVTPLSFLLTSGELLILGSANTWCEDLHLTSYVPCLAHTGSSAAAISCRLKEQGYVLISFRDNYSFYSQSIEFLV